LLYVLTNNNGSATADVAELQAGTRRPEPLVLRARAGECIQVTLTNTLANDGTDWPDHLGDAEFPRIFGRTETGGLNADSFRPSRHVSMHATVLTSNVRTSDGTNVGINRAGGVLQTVPPQGSYTYTWYAGNYEFKAEDGYPDIKRLVHQPIPFGAVNLSSTADTLKQVPQGLVGMLIVEPEDASWTVDPDGENTRTVAQVMYDYNVETENFAANFKEMVVVYQDGLNLLYGPDNIPNCHICDDSYDRGEQAWNYRSDPFWARLGDNLKDANGAVVTNPLAFVGDAGISTWDTFDSVYPQDFFLESWRRIEVPRFTAVPGENIRFRLGHPGGLARQHSFTVGGHYYQDHGIRDFGSPGTSLLAPGKSTTGALHGGAKDGLWIMRTGAQYHWAGGIWGQLVVGPPPPGTLTVAITSPINNSTVSTATIEVSGTVNTDANSVTVNGVPATVGGGLFSVTMTLSEGGNTLTAVATRASDSSTASDSVSVTYDVTAPPPPALAVSITSPADGAWLNTSTVNVTGNVSDNTATVDVNGDPATVVGGQFSATVTLSNNISTTITAVATRASDSSTASDSVSVTKDTVPPAPVIMSPADGTTVTSNRIDVSGTLDASDVVSLVVGGVQASVDNAAKTFIARNVSLSSGANVLTAVATDRAGNSGASTSITVTYTAPCKGKGCK